MAAKTLFMETTAIPPEKTAGEIIALLVESGARSVSMQYTGKRITGLSFVFQPEGGPEMPFALPVRVEPVFALLNGRRPPEDWKKGNREQWAERDRVQAERVAWRQLLRWIEAQLALMQTGMVQASEIFLPYLISETGRTMFEEFAAVRLLTAGSAK